MSSMYVDLICTAQYYACKHMIGNTYASSVQQYCGYFIHRRVIPPPSKYCLSSCPADPSPPRNVTITRVFEDGVELNWLPPTEPNGEVHYVIEYKREDSGSWASVNTTSDSTHYNLTGLHSGINYTIRVVAVNSARLHESTPITVEMTSATPTSNSTATPTYSSTDRPTSNNTVVPTPSGTNEEDKKGRMKGGE